MSAVRDLDTELEVIRRAYAKQIVPADFVRAAEAGGRAAQKEVGPNNL
jgi:hypothetical protein